MFKGCDDFKVVVGKKIKMFIMVLSIGVGIFVGIMLIIELLFDEVEDIKECVDVVMGIMGNICLLLFFMVFGIFVIVELFVMVVLL